MKQYEPATEVDFVVIGAGAAGGIMAKELSVAGFSVVVLEQGGWGAYGHEQDYNKDELQNRFPTDADRLMSDPKRQRNTFRRNEEEKADAGQSLLRNGGGWRHGSLWRQQLASSAVGVQGSYNRGHDCR